MIPTLFDGESIYINKLIIGARIYTDFHFERQELRCIRMPGLRQCRVGDVAVFNSPLQGNNMGTIRFVINHEFVKRCLGAPGDTIEIRNGVFINPSTLQSRELALGQRRLRETPDSMISSVSIYSAGQFAHKENEWTIKELGPYIVPKKGMTVYLDSLTLETYYQVIKYENNVSPTLGESYCFKENWYFFVGDNLLESWDSRQMGPVPEKFIIGIVKGVKSNNL